jgi:hypothetical protein
MVHKTYIWSLQNSFLSNAEYLEVFRENYANEFATVFPSKELLYILRSIPNCLDDLDAPDLIFEHPRSSTSKPLFGALVPLGSVFYSSLGQNHLAHKPFTSFCTLSQTFAFENPFEVNFGNYTNLRMF